VAGLLSKRDFLNGLAFKVFHCTQFIRHHSSPFYSVEPDLVHEYLGHAPMFANVDFAEFSELLGVASLGATDEDINKLGVIYWYTVEFGVCKEGNETKVYGAGILGGVKDIEYCTSGDPQMKPLDS
jgi:phenylalanine-4-hydroxylase